MPVKTALESGVAATIAYQLDLEIKQVLSRLTLAPPREKFLQVFVAAWIS